MIDKIKIMESEIKRLKNKDNINNVINDVVNVDINNQLIKLEEHEDSC